MIKKIETMEMVKIGEQEYHKAVKMYFILGIPVYNYEHYNSTKGALELYNTNVKVTTNIGFTKVS